MTQSSTNDSSQPARRVALSVLAHPDDAEILCAGTLIRLRQEHGYEVHIATATAGDCGTVDRTPDEIMKIRTGEARTAAELIGATYHSLGERDGLVVYDKPTIRKTIDLFRQLAPTIVFTHAPADYMLDHEQTSLLARAASFIASAPNASERPLAPGHAIPYLYYCDPIEGVDPLGVRVQPTAYVPLSSDVHALKLRMLSCHASQREWLRAHHGMDEYLEAVRRHDRSRAMELVDSCEFAEAFVQHRGHAYPSDNVLATLFWETC
ncbi:MAG: PIG-L deacetylase family protein [Pirellulales bacterium]